ncbi:MAG: response regulator [Pseudomonadota bacterium]
MTEAPVLVHVVDDDGAVRNALAALLASVDLPCRTHASAEAFLDQASADMAGCLLLDVRMPGMGGLELQKRLREMDLTLPVIFITGHGDVPMAVKALQAGAMDFIEKPCNEQLLLERVRLCLDEDRKVRRARQLRNQARAGFELLTPRERAVMERMAAGGSSKSIAAELEIKERTVDVHRFNIMHKVGARNLADLLKRWFQASPPEDGSK